MSLILYRAAFREEKADEDQTAPREKFGKLDQLEARCRIRIAGQLFQNDAELNKRIMEKANLSREAVCRVIASEFSPAEPEQAVAKSAAASSPSAR